MSDWHGCYDDGWGDMIVEGCPEILKSLFGTIPKEESAYKHPAKFAKGLIQRIILHGLAEGFWQPGGLVADPFGGVALGGIVAAYNGLRWVGVELEQNFVDLGNANIDLHRQKWTNGDMPIPVLRQGDSRNFANIVGQCSGIVTSPPYAESLDAGGIVGESVKRARKGRKQVDTQYGSAPGQIGKLPPGDLQAIIENTLTSRTPCSIVGQRNEVDDAETTGERKGTDSDDVQPGNVALPDRQGVRRLRPHGHGVDEGVGPQATPGSESGQVERTPGGDRTPLPHTGTQPASDCCLLRGHPAGDLPSDEEAEYPPTRPGSKGTAALRLQERSSQPRLSQAHCEGPMQPVRRDDESLHPSQEQRPLRQPPGEPGDSLFALSSQRGQEVVVEGEKGRKEDAKEQRPCGMGSLSAIITSPPHANISPEKSSGGVDLKKQWETYRKSGGGSSFEKFKAVQQRHGQGYGSTEGNIGNLKTGNLDGIVTSPPYENSISNQSPDSRDCPRLSPEAAAKLSKTDLSGRNYGKADGQIGRDSGDSYWQAMAAVYQQCLTALKPGGTLAVVVKAYVKKKKLVPLPDQTWNLLLHLGFLPIERVRASLVKETVSVGLFGQEIVETTERKSFFRRLAEKKGSPHIDWEHVLFVGKDIQG